MIDNQSPSRSWEKALDQQAERKRRNADIVSKNMTIKAMAKKGSSIAEIMTTTGMGPDYIKRIAGSYLK
jgi:hypothetical protein